MGRDRRPPAHPEWGRHLRRESRRTDVAVGRQPSYPAGAAVEILVRPGHAQAQGDRLDQGEIRRSSGAPMTDYREADVSRLKTVPIAQRPNKVDPSLLAHPPGDDPSFTAFWDSLPDILAAKDLRTVARQRSEEHTSELQSQSNLVCRLLLEKKKKKQKQTKVRTIELIPTS